MRNPRAIANAVCGVSLVALFVLVYRAHTEPVWDESYHLGTLILWNYPVGRIQTLRSMNVDCGPLYVLINRATEILFGHFNVRIGRFVNLAFLVGMLGSLALFLRVKGAKHPRTAIQILAVPLVPLAATFAMSDMSALCLFTLHLAVLALAVRERKLWIGAAAGTLLGLTVIGRQPYLVALGGALFFLIDPDRWKKKLGAVYVASAAWMPAVLFAIWGGLNSPSRRYLQKVMSFLCLELGLGQAALLYAIYDRRFLTRDRRLTISVLAGGWLVSGGLAVLGLFDLSVYMPLQAPLSARLPGWLYRPAAHVMAGVFLGLAVLFAIELGRRVLKKGDAEARCYALASLLLVVTPAKIVHNFSSRYVVVAMPLLFAIQALEQTETSWTTAALVCLGCLVGVGTTAFYLPR